MGSIIVRNKEWVYKRNFWRNDQAALQIAALRVYIDSKEGGSTLRYNALEEVHSKLGLAHMDVRLPNICFNNLYEPVLIDLDRSIETTCDNIPQFGKSCMYPHSRREIKRPEQYDWVQLGWVVASVICSPNEVLDYHEMTYESLPESVRKSEALKTLIQKGMQSLIRGGSSLPFTKLG